MRFACAQALLFAANLAFASAKTSHAVTGYVALGDSYSSGTGLGNYRDSTACYRSNEAWPVLLRSSIEVQQGSPVAFSFPACSGATTTDVRQNQLSALSKTTDLVTMTIGGNDLGFSEVVSTCLTEQYDACAALIEEKEAMLPQLQQTLTMLYKDIRKRMKTRGRLLIANYPNLISNPYPGAGEEDLCAPDPSDLTSTVCVGFDAREVERLRVAAGKLADTIAAAIAATGDKRVQLIDVRPRYIGKGCQGSPEWIRCLYGDVEAFLLNPQDLTDGSFHPNEAGHVAYAQSAFEQRF